MEGISIGIEAGFGTCRSELTARLAFAHSGIRSGGERFHCLEKLLRLTDEESAGCEPRDGGPCAGKFVGQRPDRGAARSLLINSAGTGKIRLGWMDGLSGLKKLGNVGPSVSEE